jgi:hypothetical protein
MKLSARLLLSISAVLMLLTAVMHTIGNLTPNTDPSVVELQNRMRSQHFALGLDMNPSMFDAFMLLVLIMTVTFVAFGVLNLVLASARDFPARLLRRAIWINVIWVAAYIALSWFYRVPPPLISGVVIELPLIGALLVKR